MNERIKALMGKTLDSEFSHTWDTMTYEGLLQFSEKFAELIVKECADTAYQSLYEDRVFDDVPANIRRNVMDAIKEHFGVEE